MEVDIVIAGSGAAGLTAGWAAARRGLRTLIVEKTPWIGGTSAFSGGAFWIPANHRQAEMGLADDAGAARAYLRDLLGNDYDAAKIDAYLAVAPDLVRTLERDGALRSLTFGGPDYEPWRPGAASGRSMSPHPYDARRLGAWRRRLRAPLRQMTLFGGMQISFEDVGDYLAITRSPSAVMAAGRRFARYARDRIVHGRATRLTNGNALAGMLLESALAAGATIWTEAPVETLTRDGGRVTGVVVRRGGAAMTVTAARGVLLATGGYGGNDDLRATMMPTGDRGLSLQPRENVGDGIRLGESAGGRFVRDNAANGIWYPMSVRFGRDGRPIALPHLMDRQKPGFLIVDATGRRFVNEGVSYQTFGRTMHALGIERAWLIGGHAAVRRFGIGMALPRPFPIGPHIASGYVRRAATLASLAAQTGIDAAALEASVARFDAHAAEGRDPDFHKGEDRYTQALGDPAHRPNPALGPIGRGPYYAVALHQGELSTVNGLQTDAQARVLDAEGQPIAGLYAAGVDANSIFRGHYPAGGCSLGPAMAFGYIAAREMAAAE